MKTIDFKIANFFSKINTSLIATVLAVLLSFQPLFGITIYIPNDVFLVALFYAKATVIRFIGILALLNAFVDFYYKRFLTNTKSMIKYTFIKNPWTGILALLFLWSFLTCFTSKNFYASIHGDAYRYEGFASYIAYAGIFASCAIITNEKHRNVVINSFVGASFFLAIMTLMKEGSGTEKILYRDGLVLSYSGTFINTNHYGYYLCVVESLIFGLFMENKKPYMKVVYGSIFFTNYVVMLFNGSFGPWIALLFGMIVYSIFYLVRNGFKTYWTAIIPFTIFFGLGAFINDGWVYLDIIKTAKEIFGVSSSISDGISSGDVGSTISEVNGGSGRIGLWIATIKCALDYPIFGVGPENIQNFIGYYGAESYSIPHNEVLQITANMGFPAGIMYCTAIIWYFIVNIKNCKKVSNSVLNTFVASSVYLLSSLFGVSMTVCAFVLFMMLGLTTAWYKERNMKEMISESLNKKQDTVVEKTDVVALNNEELVAEIIEESQESTLEVSENIQ